MQRFIFIVVFSLVSLGARAESAASDGAALYQKLCVSCHAMQGKPTVAPPVFAMKNHVTDAHPDREGFVNYIVEWVKAPNADTALMRGAVKKFGLMPVLGYDEAEVRTVAEWLYDTDTSLPDWYKKHYEEEHGQAPKE